jgi:hypothetical protein
MKDEHLFRFQTLDIYRVARELAQRVHFARIRDRELRDQATRASKSCFLCLCEGLPNEGAAMRHKYFVERVETQPAKCCSESFFVDPLYGRVAGGR